MCKSQEWFQGMGELHSCDSLEHGWENPLPEVKDGWMCARGAREEAGDGRGSSIMVSSKHGDSDEHERQQRSMPPSYARSDWESSCGSICKDRSLRR